MINILQTITEQFLITTHRHRDIMAILADVQAKLAEVNAALTAVGASIKEIRDGNFVEHDKIIAALDEALVKIKAFVTPNA